MSKFDVWIESHKKQLNKTLDVMQTLLGAGVILLSFVTANSGITFLFHLFSLIPTSLLLPVPDSGKIYAATFPLMTVLTATLGLWMIFKTSWVTKLCSNVTGKLEAWIVKRKIEQNLEAKN
jgi:hypothetical protein